MNNDIIVLQDLSKKVLEIANKPIQKERKELWRHHNSFKRTRPPIYVRAFAFDEILDQKKLKCEDPFYREYEYYLQELIFRDTIGDDFIINPWITLNAVYEPSVQLRWGIDISMTKRHTANEAAAYNPAIKDEDDIYKLVPPRHKINKEETQKKAEKLHSAIGNILNIDINKGPIFSMFSGDISHDLAMMRGLEQIMWDAYDRPEWLHKLVSFMSKAILEVHDQVEKEGDFSLTNHQNQAMPYAEELCDPVPNSYGVKRNELWGYMASQEFTTFGPELYNEFLLQYQIPILEKFGLVAYGCCEDLTQKIDYLRKINNLRRIAVTPFANSEKCAEQIGQDYILSWRPNPSSMISRGIDEHYIRNYLVEHFKIFRENNNYFDITLKDVETINRQPENVRKWVSIVREELENNF